MFETSIRAALVALAAVTAAPAMAASATLPFATFATQPGGTFYWQNDIAQIGGNGLGGALFTSVAPPLPAAIPISFNWVGAGLLNVNAMLSFRGISINSPAVGLVQSNINLGSFLIESPTNVVYLSGTFSQGQITPTSATSAVFFTTLAGFSSTFSPVAPTGFIVITKTGITPGLSALPGFALADFDPAATGSFGTVPEPGSWTLLLAGFGLTGAALRRRGRRRRLQPA